MMWDADLTDAAQIVAEQVDNHEVFGLVLLGGRQGGSCARVLGWVGEPSCSALDRLGLQQAAPARAQEALRRRAADLPASNTVSTSASLSM